MLHYLWSRGNIEKTAMLANQTATSGECRVSKNGGDFNCERFKLSLTPGHEIKAGDEIPPRYMTTGIATRRMDFS